MDACTKSHQLVCHSFVQLAKLAVRHTLWHLTTKSQTPKREILFHSRLTDNSNTYTTSLLVCTWFLCRLFQPWRFNGNLQQWGPGWGLPSASMGGELGSQPRPSMNLAPPSPGHVVRDWQHQGLEEQRDKDGVSWPGSSVWQGAQPSMRPRVTRSLQSASREENTLLPREQWEKLSPAWLGKVQEEISDGETTLWWPAGRQEGDKQAGDCSTLLLQEGEAGRRHNAQMGSGGGGSQRGSQNKSCVFTFPKAG